LSFGRPLSGGLDPDAKRSALGHRIQGVADQILQHATDRELVRPDEDRGPAVTFHLEAQRHLPLLRLLLEQLDQLRQLTPKVQRACPPAEAAFSLTIFRRSAIARIIRAHGRAAPIRTMAASHIFRVVFVNQGKVYEIYARKVSHGGLFGFIEVEELVFGERSSVVVDPAEERIKAEFAGVKRSYLPLHAVIRIDEVRKQGVSKISALEGGNVAAFPVPLFPAGGDPGVKR